MIINRVRSFLRKLSRLFSFASPPSIATGEQAIAIAPGNQSELPNLYATGLWDQDARMPAEITVGTFLKQVAWIQDSAVSPAAPPDTTTANNFFS